METGRDQQRLDSGGNQWKFQRPGNTIETGGDPRDLERPVKTIRDLERPGETIGDWERSLV